MKISYKEFKQMINNPSPSDVARVISKKLNDKYFIHDKVLYQIDQYMRLRQFESSRIENKVLTIVSELNSESYLELNEEQQELLSKNKAFNSFRTNAGVKKYLPQLIEYMTKDNIKFDDYKYQIHFRNGYLDLKDYKFKKRKDKQYILSYIDRDYKPSNKKYRDIIQKTINKIYPNKQDRNIILNVIGSAFTGMSEIDRTSLFLLGKSSAGKSVIMKMLRCAFGDTYVKEFDSDTFEKSNKNKDKIFNEFLKVPTIRIAWINEMSGGRTDLSLFKKFSEGFIQTTSLYKDGINSIKHNSKVILTSNELPNIQIDTGSESRILSYQHVSLFTDDEEKVDESKNIYLGDRFLIQKIMQSEELKNAIVDVIAGHSRVWMKSGIGKLTKTFCAAKNDIISSNDYMQDFIDSALIKDPDDQDKPSRLGKNEMRDAFLNMYPDRKIAVMQLISALKDKGLVYKSEFRKYGVKGSFIGYRFKTNADIASKLVDDDNNEITKLKDEITRLKQMLEEKNKTKTPKKITTKKKKVEYSDNIDVSMIEFDNL